MKQKLTEDYLVDGYLPTIGIECHVQLKTKTKLFASVSNEARGAEPNSLVSHVCFGMPGALPVLNAEAVQLSARAAFALGTKPQKFSKFDRKHYFYPDLPKGYQISQFDEPIILGGEIQITTDSGQQRRINITRAHMEEDAGKSTHPAGKDYSLVDLNRAGTPLLEIVSEPELHSSAEAKAFAKELWLRMKYAGVSDVDLYHGNMRFDVNVSISKDSNKLGTRSETKNLNSFRSVERAVDYEIKRQIKLLNSGEEVVQETRGWLDDKQKTVSQRSKEDSHDYRYFPDPDIPPVVLTEEYIEKVESELPKLPDELRGDLKESGIDPATVEELLLLDAEDDKVSYLGVFEELKDDSELAKRYATWVINIFVPLQRESGNLVDKNDQLLHIVKSVHQLVGENKISSTNAKALLKECVVMESPPEEIALYAEQKGYLQMTDAGGLQKIIQGVIESNPKAAEDIKRGEMKAIGFLVGQVMKESKGKANPAEAQKMIKKELGV